MPELSPRRRALILAICCSSLLVVAMDNTIVNVALPSLRRDLSAPVQSLQWAVDAYTLTLASFLMLAGSTADRIGRRRTFQFGLVTFGVGSLLCSLAPTIGWLIAARVLQALGGSMLNPVAMSIIANTFTDRVERAKAIGVWGAVNGLSLALGPIVGGALVDTAGWRSIFWINVPVVVVAVVCTALFVPESRALRGRRVDPVGQVLVILLLGSVVFAIIEMPRLGLHSPIIYGSAALAVLALAALLYYEPRRTQPLLELRFFRSVPFTGATIAAIATYCGFGSFLFVNTLYLQDVRGLSALQAGMYTLPVAILIVVLAPLSGRIVGVRGTRLPMLVAGIAATVFGLTFTGLTPVTPLLGVLGCYALLGLSQGSVNPPITNSAVSGMPASMAGLAASVASTSRQTGTALGVAISGAMVGSAVTRGPVAFTEASHSAWWLVAAMGLVVASLAVITNTRWAAATARQAALSFDAVDAGDPRPARVSAASS
ncbi:MAG TPA: MFS transporter [Pseudonocardia sp.]|nr:MFS transporter [Pseudonocardia sp.]